MGEPCTSPSPSGGYQPREPQSTVLFHVLQQELATFLARLEVDGRRLPTFVVRELEAFLRCGVRAYGFTRIHCDACGHDMALPFSCKGRGFCPSCGGRFMAQTAAHLVDHVLPDVPYRQWVLTLPFELRYRVAYDSDLCKAVLRVFTSTLQTWHEERAADAGVEVGRWGAVTVIQRFGSALQLTPHFHTLGFDGVFTVDDDEEAARFHRLPPPSTADVERLVERVHERVLDLLDRRGLLPDEHADAAPDPLAADEPALAACYGAAVRGRAAFGARAGERPVPLDGALGRAPCAVSTVPLCAQSGGFNLHAAVTVAAGDRYGLERICRYLARPALSHDRLEQLDETHVALELKTPFSNGTSRLVFTFHELLERLAALVPRPGTHRVRYHGILASAAKHRRLVVPAPTPPPSPSPQPTLPFELPPDHEEPRHRVLIQRLLWAELIQRVFGEAPLQCPKCGGRMRPIATIIEAKVVTAILDALGMPSDKPVAKPVRGPPDADLVEYTWS